MTFVTWSSRRYVDDLTFCGKSGQIRGTPRLRTSDEPSVRIGLHRDLGAGELQVSMKPVSEELFVLELQSSWTVASRAHSGESSAGRADGAAECARLCGAELADGKRTQTALEGLCTPPCNIPTPPTFTCALLGAYTGYSPTWLVARVPQETG